MGKNSLSDNKLFDLHNEIKLAEKRNDTELKPVIKENLERYTGSYIPDFGVDWDIYLNEVYPIVQFNIPSIYYKNPKVFLKPRNKTIITKVRNPQSGEMEEVQVDGVKAAKTQEAILNYAIEEMKYKREIQRILFDALIGKHGILWHGYKGEFGMTEEASMFIRQEQIFVKRIAPTRFLFDPAVGISNLDEGRWVGRSFDVPLEDLLEDDELDFVDKDKIKGFKGYGQIIKEGILKQGGKDIIQPGGSLKPLLDYADSKYRDSSACRFVTVYEIFKRPSKKEKREGKKGKVILLCNEQVKPLRESDWIYKAEGFPVQVLQFNELVDNDFGLDDVKTYSSIIDNKNIIRNLQIRNGQETSRVWVMIAKDGTNEEDLQKIQVGENTIILKDGDTVNGKMSVQSGGAGASSELYMLDQRIDRELQDKSGVTDLKRGFAQSGEESATSIRERSAGGAVKPQFRQDQMADFLRGSLKYLNQLLKQFMPYKDAVRISGTLDIVWSEEPTKELIQAETDVELDVLSMLPENPEREAQQLNTILQLMFSAISNPAILQKLQTEGFTFNIYPIVESLLMRMKIRDPEAFRRIRNEESLGFASVQQLKASHANVLASLQQAEIPFPPTDKDDHRTHIEIYQAVMTLLEMAGTAPEVLAPIAELLDIHGQMQMELEQKEAPKT
jgi:hypothetical protein